MSQSFIDAVTSRERDVAAASYPCTNADVSNGHLCSIGGLRWPLLPCELALVPLLRALTAANSGKETDAAVVAVLRAHPFITSTRKERPISGVPAALGAEVGECVEEHFKMNLGALHRWLKRREAEPFAKLAGGPSDDGLYTISAVLRQCMPRGLSRFAFGNAPGADVLIRGFRKFTGLTADDEDEESGATSHRESFFFTDAAAETFTVTTKSNGENGKFAVRRVNGATLLFAGSKNTCLVWRSDQDVGVLHPPVDQTIPGPRIAAAMQRIWRGWPSATQEQFIAAAGACTLMLEYNSADHEHVFPIAADFVEFVAVLDARGLPLAQRAAFALFDRFELPRVAYTADLPMAALPRTLAAERAATDREGAVLYLETGDGSPIGLLKVKSNFYVKARRIRQIFWSCLVDPLLKGDVLDGCNAPQGGRKKGWEPAEARMRAGMKALTHVEGCGEHWVEWADEAVGFVRWWRARLEAAGKGDAAACTALCREAKDKFGTLFRDYCREAGPSHGGGAAQHQQDQRS